MFVALEKLNNSNGNVTFNLYKTNVLRGLGTTPDYFEYYTYSGTEEIENVIYDKWVSEVSSDVGDFTVYVYTKRIIKHNDIDLDAIKNTGVIYRMIDEYGNDCPYDFKNIVFKRKLTYGVIDKENGVDTFVYTFSWVDTGSDEVYDFSIKGNNGDLKTDDGNISGCYGNEIGYWHIGYAESDKIQYGLNDNVFISNCPSTEQYGTYNNKLLNDCQSNSFGNYCSYNSFGDECSSNSFGNNCAYNSFGNGCGFNKFGNYCSYNSFGDDCAYNSFGNGCDDNTFGVNYIYNSFGNECYSNSFGNYYTFNSFGDDCAYNSFGNDCSSNSFGNYCSYNSFGNSCSSNSFGNECYSNSFGNECFNNSFRMSNSRDDELRDFCYYNIFENGVSYVVLYNTSTSSSSYKLQNVTVCKGMSGTNSNYNIVKISDLNVDYQIRVAKDLDGNILVYNPDTNIIKTTYSELVELRDNGKLIPGSWYRVTDYVTTTSQENTRSAGHQFDVLVLATDIDTLSEEAKAIQHEGDTYFDEANLEAWKIWYSLDNDNSKFGWACNPIETVYTYECTYNDTDYILGRTSSMNSGDKTYYCWAPIDSSEILFFTEIENPTENCTLYDEHLTEIGTLIVTSKTVEVGKGVIYRMIDERNNDCPYDFKNMQFIPWSLITSGSGSNAGSGYAIGEFSEENTEETTTEENSDELTELLEVSEVIYYYTFDLNSSSDYSLAFEKCYGNVIKEYVNINGTRELNGIVFKNTAEFNGIFCNTFSTNCYNMEFGDDCQSNSFGNQCFNNTFGNDCNFNSFGNNCAYNSFGNGFSSNSLGNDCAYNSFGNDCNDNTFGVNYIYNSFGNDCSSNSFGNQCSYNSLGNYCSYNSFGNSCSSNSFGNECYSNSFSNKCFNNSFRMSDSKDGELRDHCYNNIFETGVSYAVLYNTSTASYSYKLQNVTVCKGMSGNGSNYNIVNIPTLNANYQTKVAKNTNGDIKVYCEADLIQ